MIQTSDSSQTYNGNNSTTAPYSVPFYFLHDEDLVVIFATGGVETIAGLGTDYTVAGAQNPSGGSITTTAPIPVTTTVSITRNVPATQLTSYEEADAFPAKSHEAALDKLTMLVQQALRVTGGGAPTDLGQAFRISEASTGINAVAKKNDTVLGLDVMGNAILRNSGEMLNFLSALGSAWANTTERLAKQAAFAGQIGIQLDDKSLWVAYSTTVGDWHAFLPDGITYAVNAKPTGLAKPAGDLVGTTESQTLTNKTLVSSAITSPSGLTKADVGLSNVDNTSDANKPVSTAQSTALFAKQDRVEKGVSGGYASLDGGGKLPMTQVPDALIGASQYQGTWNAATNTPTIPAAATGNKGWYFVVNVAGTTNINGISSWAVGDQIISNGAAWEKIPNVNAVSSVNGKTGTVTLVKADIGLANTDNTSDAQKDAAASTLTNKTFRGADQALVDIRLGNDVSGNLPVNRLNSGTGAAPDTWWCGDNSWKKPPGTGDVNGPAGAIDGDLAVYNGTTGKIIKTLARNAVGDVYGPVSAVDGELAVFSGTTGKLLGRLSRSVLGLPRGHLQGLTLSNNATDLINDIDIAEGECRDSTNAADIKLLSPITKRLDAAWAVGTNQGGLDTGSIADSNGINMFVIRRADTGVVDALFSLSATAPTLPANYTYFRRIGGLRRVSGAIVKFWQRGDEFLLNTTEDNSGSGIGTTALLFSLSVPRGVPVISLATWWCFKASATAIILVTSPEQADIAPSASGAFTVISGSAAAAYFGSEQQTRTDDQGRVRVRGNSATILLYVTTRGWIDRRGRDD